MMAAMVFELDSTASLTFLALVVTPLRTCARSGTTFTLPSPGTTTRAGGAWARAAVANPATPTSAQKTSIKPWRSPAVANPPSRCKPILAFTPLQTRRPRDRGLARPRLVAGDPPDGNHAGSRDVR